MITTPHSPPEKTLIGQVLMRAVGELEAGEADGEEAAYIPWSRDHREVSLADPWGGSGGRVRGCGVGGQQCRDRKRKNVRGAARRHCVAGGKRARPEEWSPSLAQVPLVKGLLSSRSFTT